MFLLVGIAGFIPALVTPHDPVGCSSSARTPVVFGLFPINLVHNAGQIAFGIWGIAVYRSAGGV